MVILLTSTHHLPLYIVNLDINKEAIYVNSKLLYIFELINYYEYTLLIHDTITLV